MPFRGRGRACKPSRVQAVKMDTHSDRRIDGGQYWRRQCHPFHLHRSTNVHNQIRTIFAPLDRKSGTQISASHHHCLLQHYHRRPGRSHCYLYWRCRCHHLLHHSAWPRVAGLTQRHHRNLRRWHRWHGRSSQHAHFQARPGQPLFSTVASVRETPEVTTKMLLHQQHRRRMETLCHRRYRHRHRLTWFLDQQCHFVQSVFASILHHLRPHHYHRRPTKQKE